MDMEQSKLLAKMQNRAAGSYDRVKQVEAKAGGRSLPGKLKNAVGQATKLKLGESDKGNLYLYLYGTTIETPGDNPLEYRGLSCGELWPLWDDQYNSFDDGFQKAIGNLKLLGFGEYLENCSEQEFFKSVLEGIMGEIETKKPYYLFNTSPRVKDDGTYKTFIQGVVADDYKPPANERPNEHADKGYKPVNQPTTPKAPGRTAPGQTKVETVAVTSTAPGKAPPPGSKKAPPKKGPPVKPQPPVAVGEAAMTVGDPWQNGETYRGTVLRVDDVNQLIFVNFGDGTETELSWANVAPDDGQGTVAITEGNRIETVEDYFNDGNPYPGICISVDANSVKIKFDADGSIVDVPLESVRLTA